MWISSVFLAVEKTSAFWLDVGDNARHMPHLICLGNRGSGAKGNTMPHTQLLHIFIGCADRWNCKETRPYSSKQWGWEECYFPAGKSHIIQWSSEKWVTSFVKYSTTCWDLAATVVPTVYCSSLWKNSWVPHQLFSLGRVFKAFLCIT